MILFSNYFPFEHVLMKHLNRCRGIRNKFTFEIHTYVYPIVTKFKDFIF